DVPEPALVGPVGGVVDRDLDQIHAEVVAVGTGERRADEIAAVPAAEVDDPEGRPTEDGVPFEGLARVAIAGLRPLVAGKDAAGDGDAEFRLSHAADCRTFPRSRRRSSPGPRPTARRATRAARRSRSHRAPRG